MTITLHDICTALRDEDIEGLIQAGAPGDEYNSEAETLYSALRQGPGTAVTEEMIVANLAKVWLQFFEHSDIELQMRQPGFLNVARRLVS